MPTKPKRGRPPKPRGQTVVKSSVALVAADWKALDSIRQTAGPVTLTRSQALAWLIRTHAQNQHKP